MFIENINIKNFRNIKKTNIKLSRKINFLIGNNAQGKTSFIEAIYTAAFLKSFRTNKIQDVINVDSNITTVNLNINNNNVNNEVSLKITDKNKKVFIDGKESRNNKFYNFLNVIIFHPDEINYINSFPVYRRNFIDRSIFYTNFAYIDLYKKYYRCLKQRNIYLKNLSKEYDCWKDQLIEYGSLIIKERILYINRLNKYLLNEDFVKCENEKYSLAYSREYSDLEKIEEKLSKEFERKKSREEAVGYTLTGPHKDDIIFYLNDLAADKYASQGQKRSLVISCKTAQILDYKEIHGHSPVLLLDDMTSELDRKRKNILLENLLVSSGQVFITSTDFKQTHFSDKNRVFKVKDGEVSPAD